MKRFFLALLLVVGAVFFNTAHAAECSLYETLHPNFALTGAHLSTGKCTTCATCHINGIFVGTPKVCATCHVTNSPYGALAPSSKHIPIGSNDCGTCHNTNSFTATWSMSHTAVSSITCTTCHNGTYVATYNALAQQNQTAHPTFAHPPTPTGADCGNSGCHSAPATGSNFPESLWILNITQIHVGITTNCVSCHNGLAATGKTNVPVSTSLPTGHPNTPDACETCHSINNSFHCASILDKLNMATLWKNDLAKKLVNG